MAAVLGRFGSKGGVELDATREFEGAGEVGRADSEFLGMLLRLLDGRRSVATVERKGWWMSEVKFGMTKKGQVTKRLREPWSGPREWSSLKETISKEGYLGEFKDEEKRRLVFWMRPVGRSSGGGRGETLYGSDGC